MGKNILGGEIPPYSNKPLPIRSKNMGDMKKEVKNYLDILKNDALRLFREGFTLKEILVEYQYYAVLQFTNINFAIELARMDKRAALANRMVDLFELVKETPLPVSREVMNAYEYPVDIRGFWGDIRLLGMVNCRLAVCDYINSYKEQENIARAMEQKVEIDKANAIKSLLGYELTNLYETIENKGNFLEHEDIRKALEKDLEISSDDFPHIHLEDYHPCELVPLALYDTNEAEEAGYREIGEILTNYGNPANIEESLGELEKQWEDENPLSNSSFEDEWEKLCLHQLKRLFQLEVTEFCYFLANSVGFKGTIEQYKDWVLVEKYRDEPKDIRIRITPLEKGMSIEGIIDQFNGQWYDFYTETV
jgi:hypothetical protein